MDQYKFIINSILSDDLEQMTCLYYMTDTPTNIYDTFRLACVNNKINIATWVILNFKIDIRLHNYNILINCCIKGFNEIVRLLLSTKNVSQKILDECLYFSLLNKHIDIAVLLYNMGANIHVEHDIIFRHCVRNNLINESNWILSHFRIVRWDRISMISYDDDLLFRKLCEQGNLMMAQYIYDRDYIDIHAKFDYAIKKVCKNGRENVFDWLISLDENFDLSIDRNYCFRKACKYGYENIAKKIYAHGNSHIKCKELCCDTKTEHKINIHDDDDYAFLQGCYYNKVGIVQWLCELCPKFVVKIVNNKVTYYTSSLFIQ